MVWLLGFIIDTDTDTDKQDHHMLHRTGLAQQNIIQHFYPSAVAETDTLGILKCNLSSIHGHISPTCQPVFRSPMTRSPGESAKSAELTGVEGDMGWDIEATKRTDSKT